MPNEPLSVDLLVLGGMVVTMDAGHTILDRGALAVDGNEIAAIGPREEITGSYSAKRIIEAGDGLVIPGLVNGHTHLAMTLFRGLADDVALETWLQKYIWPSEARFLNPDTIRWAVKLGSAELIRTGVTTICDMYFFAGDVAAAAREVGLRGIVAQGWVDWPNSQGLSVEENVAYTEGLIERWRGDELIIPAVGPHATYTVSTPLLQRAHALAARSDVPLVIHVAETKSETEDITKKYGATPVHYLAKAGVLDERMVAAHCVWVDQGEIELLAARRVGVVHNPRSNLKLADGIAPIPDMLRQGVRVGLGTDGAASNNQLDLFAEIDAAALIHKAVRLDPLVMPARSVIEMATIGGARALGLERQIGSLEVGKRADIVILDLDRDNLVPMYDPLSHLAYAVRSADVRTVVIDGHVVLEDRELLTIDEREVRRKVRNIALEVAATRAR